MSSKTDLSKYKKFKDVREHILSKGSMYIGNTDIEVIDTWVFNNESNKFIKERLEVCRGLLKLFDEIIVNAIDHSTKTLDIPMTKIMVNIDRETGRIKVLNDGTSIDVEIHPEYKVYIPEMIFGTVFTSTNYDDTKERTTGGTFGIGAKATNIFSKEFSIEIVDHHRQKCYKQTFSDNLLNKSKPKITTCKKKPYLMVEFLPDYERFGMSTLTDSMYKVFEKRVYDAVANTNDRINIYFNDNKIGCKNFEKYVDFYGISETKIYEKIIDSVHEDRIWEIIITNSNNGFNQISFVNGINTLEGGSHVTYSINQITKKLSDLIKSKKKKDVKVNQLKEYMNIFVKATIINPSFNSQTKETLTTPYSKFGSKPEISDKFIEKIYKSDIVQQAISLSDFKEDKEIAKKLTATKKSKVIIPKLEDSNKAGGKESEKCTLILTEGDSAKTSVISGLSEVGRDYYGVFPMRGKTLNVRDADLQKITKNEEIANIIKILGLEYKKTYKDLSNLRYGKIMLLTDQDSVTFDTPCLLKNKLTGEIETKVICELNYEWTINEVNGKEYGSCNDYYIWSDLGWTDIKQVIRHKVNKKIYRVLTHTSCVDVTEDHSLLDINSNEITANDCIIKETELLHHKYELESIIDYGISEDYAYALGYFQADGCCSIDGKTTNKTGTIGTNSRWNISCVYKEPLEKLKNIFEENEIFEESKENEEIIYQCELCKVIFPTIGQYNQHKKRKTPCIIKHKLYECEKCTQKFDTYGGLERHNNITTDCTTFNKEYKIYICEFCNTEFATECFYKKHLDRKIPCNIEPVKNSCELCGKSFPSIYGLNRHKERDTDCTKDNLTTFEIIERKVSKGSYSNKDIKYELEAKGNRKQISEKYRKMFYNSLREKIVPTIILNSPINIQQAFLNGFYAGDGDKGITRTTNNFDGQHKIQILGLFQLIQNCGYTPSINCNNRKLNVYSILMSKTYNRPEFTVKKILDVTEKYTDTYVYDLETENHHFQAGIGNQIVHNTDGSHCASLIFNVFASLWPSLSIRDNFIVRMITPIVKVSCKGKDIIEFYNLSDYNDWIAKNNKSTYKITYLKGLGSSSSKEAKEYFKRMNTLNFKWTDKSESAIDLAFNKKRADDRKKWLMQYDRNVVLDYNHKDVTYEDFINKELIHFSNADIERSIPNIMDGLKESTRKILFACFKKKLNSEIKVSQLSGYVSEQSSYHHGEVSLQQAIIGMAQNYIGSNNLNLLLPIGQFGTRYMGGKDSASPRYIFTKLNPIINLVFNLYDIPLLHYLEDDGQSIQPEYYIPIIPMVLVNGACGIGTGFSTNIPCYNPRDIVDYIKKILKYIIKNIKNELDKITDFSSLDSCISSFEPITFIPWYMGFRGEILQTGDTTYVSKGCYSIINDTTIEITELPIGIWTEDYKDFLDKLLLNEEPSTKKKDNKLLKDYINYSTDLSVRFILEFYPNTLRSLLETVDKNGFNKFENDFKIINSRISTSNMHLYNSECRIKKYNSVSEIINDFIKIRIKYYYLRKENQINQLERELFLLNIRCKFIGDIITKKVKISDRKISEIKSKLLELEYPEFKYEIDIFDYLINMKISQLTNERKMELENQRDITQDKLNKLIETSIYDMYILELNEFLQQYVKMELLLLEDYNNDYNKINNCNKKISKSKKK